ncbi:NPCBM/NEW2 domain-containing protein [Pseudoduganella lutea]|uniref:Alpha-galactosidase n=1 Tax=Pseudoduganella lutea TaxID=321985 RepID=A0A4P6KUW7_9BURK|nr:NPCBM/NEW2 domain-containing protein [Pseudoduganella lutea]QBE61908.1 alpha-galactosidase [Pseudoduganella lutea]
MHETLPRQRPRSPMLPLAAALLILFNLCPGGALAAGTTPERAPLQATGNWTALARGHAPLPPMGWASWNAFLTDLSEQRVMASTRALVDSGLARAGYVHVNIDDGWAARRDPATGRLVVNTERFPSAATPGGNSFKPFADRIKAMGLKPGIYTDIGYNTCGQQANSPGDIARSPRGTLAEKSIGMRGHVAQDIDLFMGEWGFDYLKLDACGLAMYGPESRPVKERGYRMVQPWIDVVSPLRTDIAGVRNAYDEVGRALAKTRPANDFTYSVCVWGDADSRTWGQHVGNVVRTSLDIAPWWGRMLHAFDSASHRALYARPGSWNDPDMLHIGHGEFDAGHLTEARTHFAMWAIINAPLLIGEDLSRTPASLLAIYGNTDVIALNQDKAGNQGTLAYDSHDIQIIVKQLADPSKKGVVIVNRTGSAMSADLTAAHLKFDAAAPVRLRNLWSKASSSFTGETSFRLEPHESLTFEASGERELADGLYLSEMPGRVHVADDGIVVPQADPTVYRSINVWAGTRNGGERPQYMGWGGAQVDMTPYDGALQVNGKGYRTGIGILAGSRMEVKNDGQFSRFTAEVGVDDGTRNSRDAVVFEVYGDGRLLASTPLLRWGQDARALQADVAGVKVVELIARQVGTEGGAGNLVVTWGKAALGAVRPAAALGREPKQEKSAMDWRKTQLPGNRARQTMSSPGRTIG